MGLVDNYWRRWYKKAFNRWYLGPRSGFANTDYFGDIRDMIIFSGGRNAAAGVGFRPSQQVGPSFEIMVHPLFDDRENLVDYDRTDLQQELMPILYPDPNPTVLTY